VTTLDALIAEHGMPAFCKIDVEGYEAEALKGLSRPIAGLSFEYLAATIEIAIEAMAVLTRLGRYRFNLSPSETMRLGLERWCDGDAMRRCLRALPADHGSGDIYARLQDAPDSPLPLPGGHGSRRE
ncbi:MAG: FkbM family methyltransferase, partial [Alphaproteobacteria bacterium]|nr:FkbM family methyltransferase [Alphaproteobacteria bacterium]